MSSNCLRHAFEGGTVISVHELKWTMQTSNQRLLALTHNSSTTEFTALVLSKTFPFFTCGHSHSSTHIILLTDHWPFLSVCLTSSLESASGICPTTTDQPLSFWLISSYTHHCWLTTVIIHHSVAVSLQAQNLPVPQIISTLDFLPPWTDSTVSCPTPFLLSISIFVFFSFFIFLVLVSVLWGRLSWHLSAFKRTLK